MTKEELRKQFNEIESTTIEDAQEKTFNWLWSKLEERDKEITRLNTCVKTYSDMSLRVAMSRVQEQEEVNRLQLAAIAIAADCNTQSCLNTHLISKDNRYWTPAYEQVIAAIRREIVLRERLEAADKVIDCLQVFINQEIEEGFEYPRFTELIETYKSLKP